MCRPQIERRTMNCGTTNGTSTMRWHLKCVTVCVDRANNYAHPQLLEHCGRFGFLTEPAEYRPRIHSVDSLGSLLYFTMIWTVLKCLYCPWYLLKKLRNYLILRSDLSPRWGFRLRASKLYTCRPAGAAYSVFLWGLCGVVTHRKIFRVANQQHQRCERFIVLE